MLKVWQWVQDNLFTDEYEISSKGNAVEQKDVNPVNKDESLQKMKAK